MKKVVVLSGAGISAESGIATFRDANGLWEGHDVMEVASPIGWKQNRNLVLNFYNERRKQALTARPNNGHLALANLENHFEVAVVTQNVDHLHELAGSTKVIHLHGELFKVRSTKDPSKIYDLDGWELKDGDCCELGSQLRPHIVWFGEPVPMMEQAITEVEQANYLIIVGTSLNVYPAAGLIDHVNDNCKIFVVDPNLPYLPSRANLTLIEERGTIGLPQVCQILISENPS